MSSNGRASRYAVGIGSGAAGGAAIGAPAGPWGAVVGGAVGAGAGAIGAGINEGNIADEDRKIREQQALRRKQIALDMLRQQSRALGADTGYTDAKLAARGLMDQEQLELKRLEASRELGPDAFVGMAQSSARAARGVYKAIKLNVPTIENPGRYIAKGVYEGARRPQQTEPEFYVSKIQTIDRPSPRASRRTRPDR